MLVWRSLNCPHEKYLVKGSELACAFYGPHKRYLIVEIRTREQEGDRTFSGTCYVVRDAMLVSDADIKTGKRSPIVFRSDNPQKCIEYCDTNLA